MQSYKYDFNNLSTHKQMAMKEKIALTRDRMVDQINSSGMGGIEKTELANIMVDAAEGTNGLSKEDKLQNVSETVFALAVLDAQGAIERFEAAKRDREIQESIKTLTGKVDGLSDKLSTFSEQLDKNDKETEYLKRDLNREKELRDSRVKLFFDGLDKIFRGGKWYWALVSGIVLISFIFKSDIIELLKHLFN